MPDPSPVDEDEDDEEDCAWLLPALPFASSSPAPVNGHPSRLPAVTPVESTPPAVTRLVPPAAPREFVLAAEDSEDDDDEEDEDMCMSISGSSMLEMEATLDPFFFRSRISFSRCRGVFASSAHARH